MTDEMDQLKRTILEQYPRLGVKDVFQFACHRNVSCFNDCCADVNIFLTPFDIIRLKNRLGITSGELLEKYTVSPFDQKQKYPVILLKMRDDEKQRCPFVTDEGCRVYEDRPWPCRMYPMGLASPKEGSTEEEFYFLMKEPVCKGFAESKTQTVAEWQAEQGVTEYDGLGRLYKEITLHEFFEKGGQLAPEKMEMFHLVCYDIDKFRRFIFESTFFDKFIVPENVKEKLEADDVELFKFGLQWLRFSLFGEKTMLIKDDVLAAKASEFPSRSTPRG